jgi:hypothetical protein
MLKVLATPKRGNQSSIIELIARPAEFHGKLVSVVGYVIMLPERSVIYLSENDANLYLETNGIWLHTSGNISGEQFLELGNKYACVTGTFNAGIFGHSRSHCGGIKNIVSVFTWPFQNSPHNDPH